MTEEQKALEERRNVAREMAESLPKFLVNALIVLAVSLFYWFVTPLFILLDAYPLLDMVTFGTVVVVTGYSLLRIGVLLVIVFFGVEAVKEFAKMADALCDFVVSRLPGMSSKDRATVRRIPLDLIYVLFVIVVYVLVQPIFLPGIFPIEVLRVPFQVLAVSLVLFFVLTFLYDLAKSIQKSAKRGIDNFCKRIADRLSPEETPPAEEEGEIGR